jgi:uncharacterized protein
VRIWWPALDREELLCRLKHGADRLGALLRLERVVLFGSWATGRATAQSDIDLLVVYRGHPRTDAFALTWRAIDLPRLEPHVYSSAEALALEETLERMTRGGVRIL